MEYTKDYKEERKLDDVVRRKGITEVAKDSKTELDRALRYRS